MFPFKALEHLKTRTHTSSLMNQTRTDTLDLTRGEDTVNKCVHIEVVWCHADTLPQRLNLHITHSNRRSSITQNRQPLPSVVLVHVICRALEACGSYEILWIKAKERTTDSAVCIQSGRTRNPLIIWKIFPSRLMAFKMSEARDW